MSDLSRDQIKHLAALSRLRLTDAEIDEFRIDLNKILHYFEKLQQVETKGVEPTAQVTGLTNVMRPDTELEYGASREDLLMNAPAKQSGFIKVRRVL